MGFFSGLNTKAKVTPTTNAKAAKINQQVFQSPTRNVWTEPFTSKTSHEQRELTIAPAGGSSDTIGHHHKQSLCRCLDAGIALLVNEYTSGNIEEVEGYAINYTGEDEEDDARHCGITDAEEAESEHP